MINLEKDLNKMTNTELLAVINSTGTKCEEIKQKMLKLLDELEEFEKKHIEALTIFNETRIG